VSVQKKIWYSVALVVLGAIAAFSWWLNAPLTQRAPSHRRPVLYSEENARNHFGARVRLMLAARQYDALEAMADSLARTGAMFPSGTRFSDSFFARGLANVDDEKNGEQWSDLLQQLRDWDEARPNSRITRLALAGALMERGWATRGTGYAVTVSESRAEQFARDQDEAIQILQQAPVDSLFRYRWYVEVLRALHSIGWEADSSFRLLAAQATAEFPDRPWLYQFGANHRMERWYGGPGECEAYAETCASALADSLRDEIYAQIVLDQSNFWTNVFKSNPHLSWERTRRGLAVWHRNCPASPEPRSAEALLACQAGDRATAQEAFAALGDTVDVDVWNDWGRFWVAREWAYQDRPAKRVTTWER
jgi:hypothetical protein